MASTVALKNARLFRLKAEMNKKQKVILMREWKCIVCGYIHQGEEPPEKCPVCNAPKEKFIEITKESTPAEIPAQEKTASKVSRFDALFSGYVEWQKKYEGAVTKYFFTKIICGAVVLSSAIVLVIWYIIDPDVTGAISVKRWGFVFVNLIMLTGIGIAGFIGGKLVFKD